MAMKHQRSVQVRGKASHALSFSTDSLEEHFVLGVKLGEGHFGSTFKCTDKITGRAYAVKKISKTRLLMLGTALAEVRREVAILHHLSGHPNVIRIHAAFEDEKSICIVMELCEGGELYERIVSKGVYSEQEAAGIVGDIVKVVEYCHSLGVVHRDLKPENFLFVGRECDAPLKAIDFGLSVYFSPGVPITAGLAGSPLYIAPEMISTSGERYGPEIDVWSAGVIMYVLLCGYCPFPTDLPTIEELFAAIVSEEIDYESHPWPLMSEEAKDLLGKMLERDPAKRWTAAQVLGHPWICTHGVAPDHPMDPIVLSRLRQFSNLSHMRKLATRVIAQQMEEEEVSGMKKIFAHIDVDKNGSISLEEFREGLRNMGATVSEPEVEQLYEAMDADRSNSVDVREFFAATLSLTRLHREERLYSAFQYFDKDGSGFITVDEIRQVCREMNVSDEHLGDMMTEVDVNKDNRIDYSEFVAMMHLQHVAVVSKSHSLGKDKHQLALISRKSARLMRATTM